VIVRLLIAWPFVLLILVLWRDIVTSTPAETTETQPREDHP